MPQNNPPVTIAQALAGVLSTGVALAAVLIPGLEPLAQATIIAFGNSVILTGALIYQLRKSTSVTNPVVPAGVIATVITPPDQPNRLVPLTESSGVPDNAVD